MSEHKKNMKSRMSWYGYIFSQSHAIGYKFQVSQIFLWAEWDPFFLIFTEMIIKKRQLTAVHDKGNSAHDAWILKKHETYLSGKKCN